MFCVLFGKCLDISAGLAPIFESAGLTRKGHGMNEMFGSENGQDCMGAAFL